MNYYPVFLAISNKTVLVVGGGMVAQRKVETLLGYDAEIGLIAKKLTPRLEALAEDGKVEYLGQDFNEEHLNNVMLLFAATDDTTFNREISMAAQTRGILVNAVDQPADCNFIVPSIVKSGDLQIAVSTSGKSPALAKMLREQLEARFGSEYEIFLDLMSRIRKEVLSKGLPQNINMAIFNRIVRSHMIDFIKAGDFKRVAALLSEMLPDDIKIKDILKEL
jgi:precorrin-2 dehydrogenase/sirohydrochlorin ferrochelatase